MITIQGLPEFKRSLRLLKTEIKGRTEIRLSALAGVFMDKVMELVPVDTGRLKNSIGMRREGRNKIVVEAKAPYAGFVEYGTRPHIIRPRRKKVLRFEVDGKVVFATRVYHPGTSPKPYWRPSLHHTAEALPKIFDIWEVIE